VGFIIIRWACTLVFLNDGKLPMQNKIEIDKNYFLLLRASISPQDTALKYWIEFIDNIRISKNNPETYLNNLENEAKRILPLIYKNIGNLDIECKEILKESYKSTWLNNNNLLLRADKVIEQFEKVKIPTLLLKGLPFSILYYKDFGLRPMGDVDLLVNGRNLDKSIQILKDNGHQFIPFEMRYRHLMHAYHSFNKDGVDIDIHRNVFQFLESEYLNNLFWEEKQELKLLDQTANCLSDTHQMLHVLVHGYKWGFTEPVNYRWIIDAYMIEKNSRKQIDWDWILDTAVKEKIVLAIKPALVFLAEEMQISSLVEILPKILSMKLTEDEKLFSNYKVSQNVFLQLYAVLRRNGAFYRLYYENKVPFSMLKWQIDKIRLAIARRLN